MIHKINISHSAHVSGASLSFFPNVSKLPVIGGAIGFSAQGIGLIFRSKLLISSMILSAILLGGLGYIATHKALVVRQPDTQNIGNSSASNTGISQNQTAEPGATPSSSSQSNPSQTPASSSTSTAAGTSATTSTSSTSGGATPTSPSSPSVINAPSGNCFGAPSSCGYPDATNTGPVAGTVFTKVPEQATSGNGWTWDSRGWISVSGSNVTVSGIQTNANIDVTGSNVTIQNCILTANNGDFGVSLRHTSNVTVKNCRIAGANASTGRLSVAIKSIYGDDVNPRSIANNISFVSTGIQYCQGLIQDNYIHDLGYQNGDHLNGTTSNAGCDQLNIQHNTIFNNFSQTDAISLFEDFGAQQNALITNNYLAGGGYTIYGGANSGGAVPKNVQITNNRISDHYYANGGYYGWLAAWDGSGGGNVCSGNILEHTATGATTALGC